MNHNNPLFYANPTRSFDVSPTRKRGNCRLPRLRVGLTSHLLANRLTYSLTLFSLLFAGTAACADEPAAKPVKDAPAPPAEVDVAKTTERIAQDAREAGKRLAAKDPGDDTQRLQKDILDNIDALIRKAKQPPPPMPSDSSSSSSPPSPSSGMGMSTGMTGEKSTQPSSASSSSAARRKERREKQNSQANGGGKQAPSSGRPDSMKTLGESSPKMNKVDSSKSSMPRLPDVYKDVWGHLPEKMRQEMDLYFREQFMPRYSDLLRQYYSSLAERGGKKNP